MAVIEGTGCLWGVCQHRGRRELTDAIVANVLGAIGCVIDQRDVMLRGQRLVWAAIVTNVR